MAKITVNGKVVEAPEGATLFDAARLAGAEVPTLCYLKEAGALTSCMICVVRDAATGRLLPSCATAATDGISVETDCAEVRAARREVLLMLLNEHTGDCGAPCSRICPAGLNIPRMLRETQQERRADAARRARNDLIFPAVLGRVCTAPCERVCHRGQYDGPVGIRATHGALAEEFLRMAAPERPAPSGKSVAVVGAGLAGLSAACVCARLGHVCRVYEKADRACPGLRALPAEKLPPEIIDAEVAAVGALGVEILTGSTVGAEVTLDALLRGHDAVIVACALEHEKQPKLFDAVEEQLHVRAVGSGKRAARRADAFLRGLPAPPEAVFHSVLGKLAPADTEPFAVERKRPPAGDAADAARREAERCLHCDCLKQVSCKLRLYAEEHGLAPQIRRSLPRPVVEPAERFGNVVFEPGKCVKCGVCVELTRIAGAPAGMTFTGRGMDSRVRAALGALLEAGLGDAAAACVRACPTAALAFADAEETP